MKRATPSAVDIAADHARRITVVCEGEIARQRDLRGSVLPECEFVGLCEMLEQLAADITAALAEHEASDDERDTVDVAAQRAMRITMLCEGALARQRDLRGTVPPELEVVAMCELVASEAGRIAEALTASAPAAERAAEDLAPAPLRLAAARPGGAAADAGADTACCQHTAKLSAVVTADVVTVMDSLDELVAEGSEDATRLVTMRAVLARAAWLSDLVTVGQGFPGWAGTDTRGLQWLLGEDMRKAYEALAGAAAGRKGPRK